MPVQKEKPFLSVVRVQKVKRGEIKATISSTGSVVPMRSQAVRVEEPGRIAFAKQWREGDSIEKDELIATVKSEALERELKINEADVRIQRENLDIGQKSLQARLREYRTLQDLYAQGIAALKEVDSVKLELDRAVNSQRQGAIQLAKAESSLAETKAKMERLELRSPYKGLVVSRATLEGAGKFTRGFGSETITDTEGRQISSGQTVCGVVDTSQVYVRCDITSKDIGRIRPEQEADVVIYSSQDIVLAGKVSFISKSVDPDSRAFLVDILVDNPDGSLKPGMFGKADIVTERRRDTISVAKSMITRRNNQDVVFLAEKPGDTEYEVSRMVPVETGLEGRDDIEVTFGLKAGDRIVTKGFEVLQDQTPINSIDVDEPITPGA